MARRTRSVRRRGGAGLTLRFTPEMKAKIDAHNEEVRKADEQEKKIAELVTGYSAVSDDNLQGKADAVRVWMETASEEDVNKFYAILDSTGGRRRSRRRRGGVIGTEQRLFKQYLEEQKAKNQASYIPPPPPLPSGPLGSVTNPSTGRRGPPPPPMGGRTRRRRGSRRA